MKTLLLLCALLLGSPLALASVLTGTWNGELQGQALVLTLGSNGQGNLNGNPIRYQVIGNALLIEEEGEVSAYQFRLQGNQLNVTGGELGATLVLVRGQPVPPAGGHAAGNSARAGNGIGQVRQELVGKWCQASTFLANAGGGSSRSACFELKADGSYVYASESSMDAYGGGMWGGTTSGNSDAGRWSATGHSLTAQSRTGRITTYRMEKRNHPKNRDPMICLDGECYVTYWQKASW